MKVGGGSSRSVGDVGDLAPNERIYRRASWATRAYVVTFRQVDPLFVIDLTTRRTPHVLGSLKIPGFSSTCTRSTRRTS